MPSAPGTQMLWPGLQLRGLPPQHFATVVSLSPFSAAHALPVWALPYSYSDYERDGSDYNSVVDWRQRTGVALDQARTIAAHYPAGLIWADPGESPVRPPLAAIIDRHREPRLQSSQPWHLRLHVQSMRQVADLPLADLLSRPCSVAMAPGLRLDLRPYPAAPNRAPILSVQGILNRTWPSMAPDPIRVLKDKGGRPPLFQFQSVTRDMVKNECVVDSQVLRIEPKNYVIAASSAIAWPTLRITAPTIRLGITGQSVRDWVKQVRVQIWVPEDAGLAELTVSQELLKQAR